MKKIAALTVILCFGFAGCAKSENVFQNIGTNLASPSAMTVDVANNRLYVVNSNDGVLYNATQGSLQVYDITNPLAPVLLDTTVTQSFSGQMYLDPVTKLAWIPNRYTPDSGSTANVLYKWNVEETSADFMVASTSGVDQNAFGIYCCYPANRAWITTSTNNFQYIDISSADLTPNNLSLYTTLSTGGVLSLNEVNFLAVIGNRAFLSRERGGIMVVNLDLAGVAGSVPVNYFISDIQNPQGISTDLTNTNIYVVGAGTINDTWTNYLMIIDPSSLVATTTNTSTLEVTTADNSMLLATISVGNNPQSVLLSTDYAFVTNYNDNTVSVIDINTRTNIKTISVGAQPFSMALYTALDGTEKYVYVGNFYDNSISIIDIPTLEVVATYQ